MKRFIIAVPGKAYVGITGWDWYPVWTSQQAYKFTSRRGAENFADRNFEDYAIVEVLR